MPNTADPKSFHSKAEQYRVRAEELMAISNEFQDDRTRVTLRNLAAEYLKMADQMDQLSEIETRLDSHRTQSSGAQPDRPRRQI